MLERLQLLQDCGRGLKELHSRNVVHGDLVRLLGGWGGGLGAACMQQVHVHFQVCKSFNIAGFSE